MKKSKKTKVVMIAVAIAASVILPGFFAQGQAGENAPKDTFVADSCHPYYGRDYGGCTTTPTMNYAVSTMLALGD